MARRGADPRAPRRPLRAAALLLAAAVLVALPVRPLHAAVVSGIVFDDLDVDGIFDPGEAALAGVEVRLYGRNGLNQLQDLTETTAADGSFDFTSAALDDGSYVLDVVEPAAYRYGAARTDCPPPSAVSPLGRRRFGNVLHLADHLRMPGFRHVALGDSISAGESFCIFDDVNYIDSSGCGGASASFDICRRLSTILSGASTDNQSRSGEDTQDLLTYDGSNNVWSAVQAAPHLVTISIGGNDFLGAEPNCASRTNCPEQTRPFDPAAVSASLDRLLTTRANLQEILSALTAALPGSDIELNSVYDNWAFDCGTTDFHAALTPIWNAMLRSVARGQVRPVTVAEIGPEYAHADVNGANCCGIRDQICVIDELHPNQNGAQIHAEKVWESLGGVSLGARSAVAGATEMRGLELPLLRRIAVRPATIVTGTLPGQDRALGAADDSGAPVPPGAELRLSGFGGPPAGDVSLAIVHVRWRTTAAPADDVYRFEASLDGTFASPQLTLTGFNTILPIVGGSGRSGSAVNVYPDAPAYREASALLWHSPSDDGTTTGEYAFPPVTWADLDTLAVRVLPQARGAGADPFEVAWDAAWVEVYGRAAAVPPPPGEVTGVRVSCDPGGAALRWDPEPSATGYNFYRGTIGVFAGGPPDYDHAAAGSSASPDAVDAGVRCGDAGSVYWLVTAVNAGGEGPCGSSSGGAPRPCP